MKRERGTFVPSPNPSLLLDRGNHESVATSFTNRLDAVNHVANNHCAEGFRLVLFLHADLFLHRESKALLLKKEGSPILRRAVSRSDFRDPGAHVHLGTVNVANETVADRISITNL